MAEYRTEGSIHSIYIIDILGGGAGFPNDVVVIAHP